MIVNKYSVLFLFLSTLGLVLSAVLAAVAGWTAWQIRRAGGELDASRAERGAHLAVLIALVSLAMLLVGWPMLYAMLDSFVPEIPGAMCIYGVTQVEPGRNALVQTARPVLICLLVAWLIRESLRRRAGLPLRRARGMLTLAALAGLLAAAAGADLNYVLSVSSLNQVSCCCCCGDGGSPKLQAASFYLPWDVPDTTLRMVLNILFFGGIPLFALWLLWQASARSTGFSRQSVCGTCPEQVSPYGGTSSAVRAILRSSLLLLLAVVLAAAAMLEFAQVLAPLLMRLPFHHCLYCLLFNGRAPDAPLMVGNLMFGSCAAGWAAIVCPAPHGESLAPATWSCYQGLCRMSATALFASVLMVLIHLAVYRG